MLTIDQDTIRSWAEKHKGEPLLIDDEEAEADKVGLHISFPGKADEMYLREKEQHKISWGTFFSVFEDQKLALVYDEEQFKVDPNSSYRFVKRDSR